MAYFALVVTSRSEMRLRLLSEIDLSDLAGPLPDLDQFEDQCETCGVDIHPSDDWAFCGYCGVKTCHSCLEDRHCRQCLDRKRSGVLRYWERD